MIRSILEFGSSLGNMAAADAGDGLNFQSPRGQRSEVRGQKTENRKDMLPTISTIFTSLTNC
jgi:hypothetical protein